MSLTQNKHFRISKTTTKMQEKTSPWYLKVYLVKVWNVWKTQLVL